MGFASKLESEIERRNGEPPRYQLSRVSKFLTGIGTDGNFPEEKLGLDLDEASRANFDKLLVQIEFSRTAFRLAAVRRPGDKKWVSKWLSAHKKYAGHLQQLIELLAPHILRKRAGPSKRAWQQRINQIGKAKFLR